MLLPLYELSSTFNSYTKMGKDSEAVFYLFFVYQIQVQPDDLFDHALIPIW